jgi:chloramphenicol-sensitive protein RarD
MNKGVLYAGIAYVIWGFFPIFFKAIHAALPFEIVAHRVFWSFLFVTGLMLARKEIRLLLRTITRRTVLIYLAASILLAINWLTYVWAVNSGFVLETSLGYFINPLVNVLLGVIILGEKLRFMQWVPIGLAAAGVTFLTISLGAPPWISLVLAFSFGLYGLVKKIAPLNSLHGLTLETGLLVIPAFGFLIFSEWTGTAAFGRSSLTTTLLLALTGVITAVPLLLFATGARLVTLTTLGLLQYIAPTLQFLIGVFIFGEPLTTANIFGFVIIWTALAIFSGEGLIQRHRTIRQAETINAESQL